MAPGSAAALQQTGFEGCSEDPNSITLKSLGVLSPERLTSERPTIEFNLDLPSELTSGDLDTFLAAYLEAHVSEGEVADLRVHANDGDHGGGEIIAQVSLSVNGLVAVVVDLRVDEGELLAASNGWVQGPSQWRPSRTARPNLRYANYLLFGSTDEAEDRLEIKLQPLSSQSESLAVDILPESCLYVEINPTQLIELSVDEVRVLEDLGELHLSYVVSSERSAEVRLDVQDSAGLAADQMVTLDSERQPLESLSLSESTVSGTVVIPVEVGASQVAGLLVADSDFNPAAVRFIADVSLEPRWQQFAERRWPAVVGLVAAVVLVSRARKRGQSIDVVEEAKPH